MGDSRRYCALLAAFALAGVGACQRGAQVEQVDVDDVRSEWTSSSDGTYAVRLVGSVAREPNDEGSLVPTRPYWFVPCVMVEVRRDGAAPSVDDVACDRSSGPTDFLLTFRLRVRALVDTTTITWKPAASPDVDRFVVASPHGIVRYEVRPGAKGVDLRRL